MADVIHEHYVEDRSRRYNPNFVIGLILVIVLVVLFFYYGLPAIKSAATPTVSVPEQVDVNVNTPQQPATNQTSEQPAQ